MKNFDVKKVTFDLIDWIKDYFDKQPSAEGAIIGVSGGKDSTVVAKLLVESLGKARVFGVLMPNGEQKDIKDSLEVVELLDIDYEIVNINDAYIGLLKEIGDINRQALINIPPRLRMTTLYALGQDKGYRVAGTGNLSERYVGYTTKWGDSACDFNPIGNLTTEEVCAIGEYLGLPKHLVYKTPSDGLCGATDEDNLGFTYRQVNDYIKKGTCGDKGVDQKIWAKNIVNEHKQKLVPTFNPVEEITKF